MVNYCIFLWNLRAFEGIKKGVGRSCGKEMTRFWGFFRSRVFFSSQGRLLKNALFCQVHRYSLILPSALSLNCALLCRAGHA
jgi:hypothetical protein